MPNARTYCFVDTNLLVYAVDPAETEKRRVISDLLRRLIRSHTLVLSVQSLNECYRVLTDRRGLMPGPEARQFIEALAPFCSAPLAFDVMRRGWSIQDASRLSWWDCLLLGSAVAAGCGIFLSEDMQDGQKVDTLTIVNPFKHDLTDVISKQG